MKGVKESPELLLIHPRTRVKSYQLTLYLLREISSMAMMCTRETRLKVTIAHVALIVKLHIFIYIMYIG